MHIELKNEQATETFAEDLAMCLRRGDVIALCGDLGVGKSALARALIRSLADNPDLEVPSPTFTLLQTYDETRIPLAHADIYRIASEEDIEELGFNEYSENGILVVEWAEKAPNILTQAQFCLHMRELPGGRRMVTTEAQTDAARRLQHSLSIRAFLQKHGRGNVKRRFLQGDASPRAYEKLLPPQTKHFSAKIKNSSDKKQCRNNKIEILMDAPATEIKDKSRAAYLKKAHLALHNSRFTAIDELLCRNGFKAPRIYAKNTDDTLLILEDLGQTGLLQKSGGKPLPKRYIACGEFLAEFHQTDWAAAAKAENCILPHYDSAALQAEVDVFADWYLPYKTGSACTKAWREKFCALWKPLFSQVQHGRPVLVLRDFHSPNILWQKSGSLKQRIGLIDFQDAVLGSPAYDLVSVAQDARVDISASLEQQIYNAYQARRLQLSIPFDKHDFAEHYAVLGAQRACKILGIFIRLNQQDGKAHYMRHLPRINTYLQRNLQASALKPMQQFFAESKLLP